MKIALVHDYLSQDGGAERVLKSLHEIWPQAPIFVLFHDRKKLFYFDDADVRESFLARLPFSRTRYEWYLSLMPLATESFDLKGFDVVVSSSSNFAKGVITGPETLHISYCHTTPRFLWADNYSYVAELKHGRLVKSLLPRLIHHLRLWDKMSVDRVDHFIANSRTVQQRINKYYRRESKVIYPPVDTHLFSPQKGYGDYFVAGGRLVPYKHTDLVIQVFNRLRWPLKIFGTGSELGHLQKMAKPNIEFLGHISEEEKVKLLSGAKAIIYPQVEDLGITAIECMAGGRPVIAFNRGGATETVIPGETGVFFANQNWESLLHTLLEFEPSNWDSDKIREQALQFSADNFKEEIRKYVTDRYEEFKKGMNQETLIK